MSLTSDKIIGDLVAEDYRAATVFKKHNIDFCCNGNRPIKEACEAENLDAEKITEELVQILNTQVGASGNAYQSWPLDLLADYVEKTHHRYVEEKIQEIKPYLEKICKVHGDRHPELFKIKELFEASAGEFAMHMKKEELVLFPLIRKLEAASKENKVPERSVVAPINQMMSEHENEGERFREIAALSGNYTAPADACNTYRVTYGLLKEFEDDLHLHIHIENNILFPRSIEREEGLVK